MNHLKKNRGSPRREILKWTLNMAEDEFGTKRDTLAGRARQLAIEPSEDGFFTSRQIAAMLFGDKEAEVIGKLAAERGLAEHELARKKGEVIRVELAEKLAAEYLVPARQRILGSGISDEEKNEILADLVKLGEIDWQTEATKDDE